MLAVDLSIQFCHGDIDASGIYAGGSLITGAHAILYSTDAKAGRAFPRELLGTPSVDAGEGWLIVALPPAEVAVHPTDGSARHELCLMCDDIEATVAELSARGVSFEGGISDEVWGLLTTVRLPGGGPLGIYQPRHPLANEASPVRPTNALGIPHATGRIPTPPPSKRPNDQT